MEILSLSQLNLYIRRVIALNFQEPVWITAELLSIKSKSGHVYLDLSEKDDKDQLNAQNAAVIWKSAYDNIYNSIGADLNNLLKEGNSIKILVNVDYHIRYGLKLNILNIDPSYTFGKIAEARIQTIEKLKTLGLWQKNKLEKLPEVIKNIAVVSSIGSAGKDDFINHLNENLYNYGFNIRLFNVSVQGHLAVSEICNALQSINPGSFDAIVLIRGGGSKLDLAEYDSYEIAYQISLLKTPVLTGIGHFIDESIADLSAYLSLKTPTAVADFILQHNNKFEVNMIDVYQSILSNIRSMSMQTANRVITIENLFKEKAINLHHTNKLTLTNQRFSFDQIISETFHNKVYALKELNYYFESNDPDEILKKGYCLSYKSNKVIKGIEDLATEDQITLRYYNGELTTKVEKIWQKKI